MKRVLITGKNSYIGQNVENWLNQYPEQYYVETVGTRNDEWKHKDFSGFDVVFHVAGIAHVKETNKNRDLYIEINGVLPAKVAEKAKQASISQFIFMSSMSIYGDNYTIQNEQKIDAGTKPNPDTNYGKSKLYAEEKLTQLSSDDFKILILRPPMIYGKNAKGNYNRLLSKKELLIAFPDFKNKRSWLSIDNLCVFIKDAIDLNFKGIYCPTEKEYLNTSQLIKEQRLKDGKKTFLTTFFNPLIIFLSRYISFLRKMFGSNYYSVNNESEHYSLLTINPKEGLFYD